VDEIDSRGIGFINAIALRDAALNLELQPEFVLSDAFRLPEYAGGQLALIKGDCRSRSIALASTVAKVTRDRLMVEFDRLHPGYGFARHKGYGTAEHRRALEGLGPCAQHRRSFAPIRLLLGADGGC
jgi:ribonuclease HII